MQRGLSGRAALLSISAALALIFLAIIVVQFSLRNDSNVHPNIIILVADDLGVDWAPCFADNGLMPNVEQLCKEGVVFDRTYATPSCAPSRATILTGRYALRTQAGATARKPNDPPNRNLSLEEIIIPEVLDQIPEANYRHAAFGKWHLSDTFNGGRRNPILAGFQNYYGTMDFGSYYDWRRMVDGEYVDKIDKYKTTAFVDDAISWISESGDRPWLAWVAFYNPHSPWHVPPTDLHDFKYLERSNDINDPQAETSYPEPKELFSAMLQALDTEIGRLLNYVEQNVQRKTYIVFIGDNGTSSGVAFPDFGTNKFKSTIYEGGIHVPLVISGPDIVEPGRRVSGLVNSTDLFSTVIELASGKPVIEELDLMLDSVSLVPYLFDSQSKDLRAWAFSDTGNEHRKFRHAVLAGNHKLIIQSNSLRLFDIVSDPYEDIDLLKGEFDLERARQTQLLFSRFLELYQSEDDPYTDVKIEELVSRYGPWLCATNYDAEDINLPALLPCST